MCRALDPELSGAEFVADRERHEYEQVYPSGLENGTKSWMTANPEVIRSRSFWSLSRDKSRKVGVAETSSSRRADNV